MTSVFQQNLSQLTLLLSTLHHLDEPIAAVAEHIAICLRNGGKVLFCGNGGSAADSQHLASELAGRFVIDRKPLSGLALTTDTSALTSIGNDYAFNEVFARQVMALGRQGDVLVGISTSGNSGNVVRAVEEARRLGIHTVGLLGRDGGQLRKLCDSSVVVASDSTARIQECHILIGHTLCEMLEQKLGLV
jgi:D-sedoheptulose 7-phosphate isomerase